jgi:ribosomal protein S18 acetylase RimI-like enzyme
MNAGTLPDGRTDDADSAATTLVRPAAPEDLAIAGEICVEAYDLAGQLEPGSPYASTLRDTSSRAEDSLLLVAVRDNVVIGTVTICSPGSASREIGRDDEVEFRFLAVAPSAWRTGVAEALVAACEEHARETGASALAICVRDTNTSAAAMYGRMGFTRVPERDWTPRPGVDLLALTRPVLPR